MSFAHNRIFDHVYGFEFHGREVIYSVDKIVKVKLFVDPTDLRVTIESIHASLNTAEVEHLTRFLEQHFGAKRILDVPPEFHAEFEKQGYSSDPMKSEFTKRFRQTSARNLANIEVKEDNDRFDFVSGAELKNTSKENIAVLMQNSGFLKSRLDTYKMQGYAGFQLMCKLATPYGIRNKATGELVAFCRVKDLGRGKGYLCDTWVDEKTFGTKAAGTALLYKQVGLALNNIERLLLIAPDGRVDEFEKDYGCTQPKDILLKFGPAMLGMTETFVTEKDKLNEDKIEKMRSILTGAFPEEYIEEALEDIESLFDEYASKVINPKDTGPAAELGKACYKVWNDLQLKTMLAAFNEPGLREIFDPLLRIYIEDESKIKLAFDAIMSVYKNSLLTDLGLCGIEEAFFAYLQMNHQLPDRFSFDAYWSRLNIKEQLNPIVDSLNKTKDLTDAAIAKVFNVGFELFHDLKSIPQSAQQTQGKAKEVETPGFAPN